MSGFNAFASGQDALVGSGFDGRGRACQIYVQTDRRGFYGLVPGFQQVFQVPTEVTGIGIDSPMIVQSSNSGVLVDVLDSAKFFGGDGIRYWTKAHEDIGPGGGGFGSPYHVLCPTPDGGFLFSDYAQNLVKVAGDGHVVWRKNIYEAHRLQMNFASSGSVITLNKFVDQSGNIFLPCAEPVVYGRNLVASFDDGAENINWKAYGDAGYHDRDILSEVLYILPDGEGGCFCALQSQFYTDENTSDIVRRVKISASGNLVKVVMNSESDYQFSISGFVRSNDRFYINARKAGSPKTFLIAFNKDYDIIWAKDYEEIDGLTSVYSPSPDSLAVAVDRQFGDVLCYTRPVDSISDTLLVAVDRDGGLLYTDDRFGYIKRIAGLTYFGPFIES